MSFGDVPESYKVLVLLQVDRVLDVLPVLRVLGVGVPVVPHLHHTVVH